MTLRLLGFRSKELWYVYNGLLVARLIFSPVSRTIALYSDLRLAHCRNSGCRLHSLRRRKLLAFGISYRMVYWPLLFLTGGSSCSLESLGRFRLRAPRVQQSIHYLAQPPHVNPYVSRQLRVKAGSKDVFLPHSDNVTNLIA